MPIRDALSSRHGDAAMMLRADDADAAAATLMPPRCARHYAIRRMMPLPLLPRARIRDAATMLCADMPAPPPPIFTPHAVTPLTIA